MAALPQSMLILICFFVQIFNSNALSTVPTFTVSNKYCQAATYTLDTTPYYNNITANSVSFFTFNIPLLKTHASYQAVSSITTLNFVFTAAKQLNVTTFINSYGTSSLNMAMMSMRISGLSTLAIRYILLDYPYASKMTHFYSGATYYVNNSATVPFSSLNPINTLFGVPAINTIGTTKAFVAFSGLNATATDATLTIDMKFAATYPSSTTMRVAVTSASTKILNVGAIVFCIIGFNVQDAMAWPFPAARLTTPTFLTSSPATDSGNLFQSYNSFWGLTYVQTANQATLTFDSSLVQNTSISGQSTFQTSEWIAIIYETKECDSTTPYYMKSSDICYDICPNLYYEDSTNYLCQNCTAYDCLKCVSNGTCTACDTTTRALNSSTGRCDPLPGYYDTGSLNASICDSHCKTCSVAYNNCTSCNSGKYLNSGSCSPCVLKCDVCTNATACVTCINDYVVDSSGLCVLSVNCSQIANCVNCTASTGCVQCSSGYSNLLQVACSSICGDGLLSPMQECDVGSNITTGCINCTIVQGHFCTGAIGSLSTCSQCMSNCINCTNLTVCLQCDSHFTLSSGSLGCQANCSEVNFCLTCSVVAAAVQCNTCTNGYNLSATKQCVSACENGASLVNGGCIQNDLTANPQPKSLNLLYILLPLLLGLLLCCCCIIFCIWRRRKNEENKVQEENEAEAQNAAQNKNELHETVQVQTLNQSKDAFDEKALSKKKTKYRGDSNKSKVKQKKRKTVPREQTEENVVSLQEFKDTLELKNPQSKRKTEQSVKVVDANLHIIPISQQNHLQLLQLEPQVDILGEKFVENQKILEDGGNKSEIDNEDITHHKMRDDLSDSNETKQQEQQQEQRGR